MENDTRLEDHDSDNFIIVSTFLAPALGSAVGEVIDQERDEKPGHEDGGRCSLVFGLAETFVVQHESCMGEELWGKLR